MKTYSAALNGTLNLQIWGPKDTWKSEPKWKTIQLLLMKLKICKSCWSKGIWKSGPKWKTIQLLLMWLQICKSCKSQDTWKSRPKWKTIQQLLMWLLICKSCKSEDENQDQNEKSFNCTQCSPKFTNPADLKIHENHDQIKNPSAALNTALSGRICWPEDTWKSWPIWKPIQLLFMVL